VRDLHVQLTVGLGPALLRNEACTTHNNTEPTQSERTWWESIRRHRRTDRSRSNSGCNPASKTPRTFGFEAGFVGVLEVSPVADPLDEREELPSVEDVCDLVLAAVLAARDLDGDAMQRKPRAHKILATVVAGRGEHRRELMQSAAGVVPQLAEQNELRRQHTKQK
jgi:hypothetical protein